MTDNELIAKFMGGWNANDTRHLGMNVPHRGDEWSDYKDMKYSTSWDWLIPVVKKITNTRPMNQAWYDVKYHLIEGNIDVVYERVVSFIKWFETREGAE